MADKEKKVAQNSDVEKATTDEKKVAKAAKGNANKKDKPNFFVRAGRGAKNFYKNFKGECKKIVWPDAKTVLKSTGIVILVVAIVGLIVYGIDQGLTAAIEGLESLATSVTETTDEAVDEDTSEESSEGDESEESTDESEETTDDSEETTEAETSEEATEGTEE